MTLHLAHAGNHPLASMLDGFDGTQGTLVREPERPESAYWVGCPGAYHDADTGAFYLTYRRRHPRGVDHERGYINVIARSGDGVHFDDIAEIRKEQLDAASMERSCLRRTDRGWVLYLSYVDPADGRWRIDALHADDPEHFDPRARQPVLTAATTGTEGVKDPYVTKVGPVWMMIASYAAARPFNTQQRASAHSNGDIYTTGMTTHPTGLATSLDGLSFEWQGEVFPVGEGWDRYQSRIGTVLSIDGGYLGFYDGSASKEENYEERCGLAYSGDLTRWTRLTPSAPRFVSPDTTHALRYVDAVQAGGKLWLYYERARPDGAHELRVLTTDG